MLEDLVKRNRMIALVGLTSVIVLSWTYLLAGAGMDMDAAMPMPDGMGIAAAWTPGYAAMMFIMWWVMMMAMMLPSAAPMILLFSTVNRKAAGQNSSGVPTFVFAAGYLLIWGAFSAAATLAQWLLTSFDLLDQTMQSASPLVAGSLLIAAGLYQFTAVKDACLRNCRTPIQFVMTHWTPGRIGAVKMGMLHGIFCLGCCWFLMGLLFVGGVMNIVWIGGLAIYVLIEKLCANGPLIGKLAGAGAMIWGGSLIAVALAA